MLSMYSGCVRRHIRMYIGACTDDGRDTFASFVRYGEELFIFALRSSEGKMAQLCNWQRDVRESGQFRRSQRNDSHVPVRSATTAGRGGCSGQTK